MTGQRTTSIAAPTVSIRVVIMDAVSMAVLITAASLPFGSAYGGYRWLIAIAGGALLGALIAGLATVLRWSVVVAVPLVALGYFGFGAALATPQVAAGGLPNVESVRLLTLGAVSSWRQMLTVATPVGFSGALLVPAYLSAVVLTATGVSVSTRSGFPRTALLAPAAMAVIAALFGGGASFLPLVSGTVVALGGVVWASWHANLEAGAKGGGLDIRRPLSAVSVLALAVLVALAVTPALTPTIHRAALRDSIQQPLDPREYPSPLSAFRKYAKTDADTPMFSVTGLPANTPIRLAALDAYDGIVYQVSDSTGAFDRVGDVMADPGAGTAARVQIEITGYSGLWLPTVGNLAGISFGGTDATQLTSNFRYASGSSTGIVTQGVGSGDSYTVDVRIPAVPTPDELEKSGQGTVTLPIPGRIPDAVKAAALADTKGATSLYDKAKGIEQALAKQGILSHGDSSMRGLFSPAGHGLNRLNQLLTAANMTGDGEQFAPAMALMLRTFGIPARVVLGFTPDSSYAGAGTLRITGSDISAWVEVDFAGYGWVPFYPTPVSGAVPPQPDSEQASSPRQQVLIPPPLPPTPIEAKAKDVAQGATDPEPPPPPAAPEVRGSKLAIWLGAGTPLLFIALVAGIILVAKQRRRRRRRAAAAPVDRIAGGWRQVLDAATDLRHPVPVDLTRSEAARAMDAQFGTTTLLLAADADQKIFDGAPVHDAAAAAFWIEVDAALLGIRSRQSALRRLRAGLSVASLRTEG